MILHATSQKRLLMGLMIVSVGFVLILSLVGLEPIQELTGNSKRIRSFEKTWTWSCEELQCIRLEWNSTQAFLWTSLAQCRLTCGTPSVIWPRPTGRLILGRGARVFNPDQLDMKIHRGIDYNHRRLLKKSFDIFKTNVFSLIPNEDSGLARVPTHRSLQVTVFLRGDGGLYLTLDTNESYRLELEGDNEGQMRAYIIAHTFFGARHALETLSQLIWWETNEFGLSSFKIIDRASVEDAPRFNYRGVMIDTSRNFIPIPSLRSTINGMAASKLNTLHLHLTDTQSFSFDSPRFPQMSRYGAYAPDKVYSARDLSELTEYARLRGVRILPEVDTPAHAGVGWQWGEAAQLGKLAVCVNRQPWSKYCGEPPCGQLNPSNNNTYAVLRGIYQDLIEITQLSDLFHIGGDEVNENCWLESSDVFTDRDTIPPTEQDFKNKLTEFHTRAFQELETANQGKFINNVIVWSTNMERDDLLRTFPREKYIIQEWGGSTWKETQQHLQLGYRLIMSHVDAWYLDCGFGSWLRSRGDPCGPVTTWQAVYAHRPWGNYTAGQARLVLGGEVCLWSEKNDEHTVDARIWPRAAALAERLWSDPPEDKKKGGKGLRDAMLRLAIHRELLIARGIRPEVMWPQWCNDNPDSCT